MATRRSNEPRRAQTPAALSAAESAETTAQSPSTSTRTRKRAPAKQTAAAPPTGVTVSADVRRGMIAEAAYLRAERRGFAPGHEEEDWYAAEKEVDARLASGHVWGGPQ
jgi:Protein of unknown function (DUF2934)